MDDLARELVLIADGNELAFNEFMNRYTEDLYCYVYGIISNKEMTEEVVSDVFLETWRNRKNLTEINSLKSWLYTIAYRRSVSYLRKEKWNTKALSLENVVDSCLPESETPVDGIIKNENVSALYAAIDELPPRCKHVFFLAKLECIPYAQIAKVLNISIATVDYHIGHAMNALKKKMSM